MPQLAPVRSNVRVIYKFLTTLLLFGGLNCTPALESRPVPELPPPVARAALPSPGAVQPLRQLTLAWTGALRGEITACGCPTVPYGGLARREQLLKQLREQPAPVFMFDAGDMLVKGLSTMDLPRRKARAMAILGMLDEMGLDAWVPSPDDLLPGGLELLKDSPLLSSNWDADIPRLRMLNREGLKIGVLGLSATDKRQTGGDATQAIQAAMEGQTADLWVVLSNSNEATEAEVAKIPGIGVILSTAGEETNPPQQGEGAPIIEVPDRGRYVSVVRVFLGSTPGPLHVVDTGIWARVATEWRISQQSGRPARMEGLQAELAMATAGLNMAVVDLRPLGSDLDGPSPVQAQIDAFASETIRLAMARAAPEVATTHYAGTNACVSCHRDRFAAWGYDPHKKALEALRGRGKEMDPECVGCHTTGFGEVGGWAELTPDNLLEHQGVQCEACHGPLGSHPNDGVDLPPITAKTCEGCHDAANSPSFDAERYLRRISCTMVSHGGAASPQ